MEDLLINRLILMRWHHAQHPGVNALALTEQVSVDFLCRVCRLLIEKRCRDLLLLLAKLRSGDTALWNLPPPPSPPSSSSSSLSSSSPEPHTSSRAPCMECLTLPTQSVICSWAADSFSPKYCIVVALTTGRPSRRVTMETGPPKKLYFSFVKKGIL